MTFFRRRARASDVLLDLHLAQGDPALRAAWDAVRGGDWHPARELMASTRSDPDRRARYVWVLGESATAAPWAEMTSDPQRAVRQVDTYAAWADWWAEAEPDNADALLVRCRSLIMRAWEVRGSGWASSIGTDAAVEFRRLLLLALPLCDKAARLAPEDPTPHAQRLLLAIALGDHRDDFERLWAEVVARDPWHREAHSFKLMYLCRKWRGSHEEMFAFARETAAAAPDGSPLHVLPIQANAEWAMWELQNNGSLRNVMSINSFWWDDPQFRAELDTALSRWFSIASRRHAMWYHDLNFLAYGLTNARRYAKAVFEAIGPYMETIPWGWRNVDPQKEFSAMRTKALRS